MDIEAVITEAANKDAEETEAATGNSVETEIVVIEVTIMERWSNYRIDKPPSTEDE